MVQFKEEKKMKTSLEISKSFNTREKIVTLYFAFLETKQLSC